MAAIFQTTFSNTFFLMKMFEFRLTFHSIVFLRVQLTISWTNAGIVFWRIYASLGLNELIIIHKLLIHNPDIHGGGLLVLGNHRRLKTNQDSKASLIKTHCEVKYVVCKNGGILYWPRCVQCNIVWLIFVRSCIATGKSCIMRDVYAGVAHTE